MPFSRSLGWQGPGHDQRLDLKNLCRLRAHQRTQLKPLGEWPEESEDTTEGKPPIAQVLSPPLGFCDAMTYTTRIG